MEWMLLTHFHQSHEAHLARSVLESEGIPVYLADEHISRMTTVYAPAFGGVRLYVQTVDVDTAQQLLSEDFSDAVDQLSDSDLLESEHNAESEDMSVRDQHRLQMEAGVSFSSHRPRREGLEGQGWIFWIGLGTLGLFLVWHAL